MKQRQDYLSLNDQSKQNVSSQSIIGPSSFIKNIPESAKDQNKKDFDFSYPKIPERPNRSAKPKIRLMG
jgi:hypothetical protein